MRRSLLGLAMTVFAASCTLLPATVASADGGGWDETWGGGIDDIVIVNATPDTLTHAAMFRMNSANGFKYDLPDVVPAHAASPEFRIEQNSALQLHYMVQYRRPDGSAVVLRAMNDGIHDNDSFTCEVGAPYHCRVAVDDGYPRRVTVVILPELVVRTDGGTPTGRALIEAVNRICGMEPDDAECDYVPSSTDPPRQPARTKVGPRIINCHQGDGTVSLRYSTTWSHTESISVTDGVGWGLAFDKEIVKDIVKLRAAYSGWWDSSESESTNFSQTDSVEIGTFGAKQLNHGWEYLEAGGEITVRHPSATAVPQFSVSGATFRFPQRNDQSAVGDGDIIRAGECPIGATSLQWLTEPLVAESESTMVVNVSPGDGPLAGRPAPTGTVTFLQAGRELCDAVPVVDGRASCTARVTPASTSDSTVTADYSGDTTWAPRRLEHSFDGARPATIGGLPVRVIPNDSALAKSYIALDTCPGTTCVTTPVATSAPVRDFHPVVADGKVVAPIINCRSGSTSTGLSWTSSTGGYEQYGHVVSASVTLGGTVSAEVSYRRMQTESWDYSHAQRYDLSVAGDTVVRLEAAIDGYWATFDHAIRFADEWVVMENVRRFIPFVGHDARGLSTSVRAVSRPATPDDCTSNASSTTLSIVDPEGATVGEQVTLVADVRRTNQPGAVGPGTVTFTDSRGGLLCESVVLVDSAATCQFTPTSSGHRTITARYSGVLVDDVTQRLGSSSDSEVLEVHRPISVSAGVVLDSEQVPVVVVEIDTHGGPAASGSVTFEWAGNSCEVAVVDGRATACRQIAPFDVSDVADVAIAYSGDANYRPATRPDVPARLSVSSAPAGEAVELSVQIRHTNETPQLGQIVVTRGTDELCRIQVEGALASCLVSGLSAEPHTLTVRYEGSTLWRAQPTEVTVLPPPVATTPAPPALAMYNDKACAFHPTQGTACWGTHEGNTAPWLTGVVEAHLGRNFGCALTNSGTITCWGSNSAGEATPPEGTFVAVDTSLADYEATACGVRSDGQLTCWGSDYLGAATPPSGTFVDVSMGAVYGCAIRTTGSVACWGRHPDLGRLLSTPVEAIDVGPAGVCGITHDGQIVCAADNPWNEWLIVAPTTHEWFTEGRFTDVAVGRYGACALTADGLARCWNTLGAQPVPEVPLVGLSAGKSTACGVVAADHQIICWAIAFESDPIWAYSPERVLATHQAVVNGVPRW